MYIRVKWIGSNHKLLIDSDLYLDPPPSSCKKGVGFKWNKWLAKSSILHSTEQRCVYVDALLVTVWATIDKPSAILEWSKSGLWTLKSKLTMNIYIYNLLQQMVLLN